MEEKNIHYKDGTILAKGKMLGDHMNGCKEWYRKSSVIMRSGYFANGKQVGAE